MRGFNRFVSIVGLAAVAGSGVSASASVIATHGFDELVGSYNGTGLGGNFNAQASNAGVLKTQGDVSRVIAALGTALFSEGFLGSDSGDVDISLSVGAQVGNTRPGAGTLTFTDAGGDTITANVSGTWLTPGNGIVYFNGGMTDVSFNGADGDFNGSSGGSFDYSDFQNFTDPLTGNITLLFIRSGVGFFNTSFNNVSVESTGNIIPAPGSVALVGLGLAGLAARRRGR